MNEEFVFKYKNHNTLIKTYGEQFESNWWYITENKIPVDNKLLSIIIYADSTTCDHLGKTSEHPIYISLGNIPNWQRNKPNAKVLVGYLPKLKAKDNTTRNSESFRRLQRLIFQRFILADMAEAGAFTATYLPSTSKRPCYYCLINNEDLNNMALSHIDLRTPEKMKLAISENQASEFSIHKEFNYFWDFDDFNIYEATAPDRMHLLDLGVTKYLIEFTHELLHQKVSNRAVKDMDHRLCAIPRYPGLIILKNRLENISKFTANDYRNIMKVIIFVIDNLYDDYKEGGIPCKRLCNIFHKYLVMYMKLRQESFTDTELTELETLITEFCQEFVTIFAEYSPSRCKIPKLHVLRYHVIPSIRLYDTDIHHLYKEGFDNLHAGFEEFLTENELEYDYESGHFKIYSSVAVESTDIIRTAGTFYGNEWFSDVVVSSEETAWYGKALLLLEFSAKGLKEPVNLALLRWYEEVQEEEIIYDCPRLWLTDQYTCVYLDSVDMSVHIIPRNNCENEYFVNTYIF
ncbi:hypothetical protein RclHR1_17400001 [Rhizophagus clarus]|uniref:Uncharacterized protein n=1 Tax=Rhizophagus clarus TaxID=94130 RepID=A0A2Z6QK21_9GLOM|nr:hypothetical protein RclHR1_17400001 [Rhizophagus clarus]